MIPIQHDLPLTEEPPITDEHTMERIDGGMVSVGGHRFAALVDRGYIGGGCMRVAVCAGGVDPRTL